MALPGRVRIPTEIENPATHDGARIDLSSDLAVRVGAGSRPVYVRTRPPLPADATANCQADSSVQIAKPQRATSQKSETQKSASSRSMVGVGS